MTEGPRLRATLKGIPTYKPGRMPKPASDRPTYKLSSNETPFPPLAEIAATIGDTAKVVNRYPDTTCGRLVTQLVDKFDVPPGDLAVGTGSVALIYHLMQAFVEPGDEVVYAWRSFEAYPIAAQVASATRIEVPLKPGARHDLEAMADAVTDKTKVVMVCSPNNPTGPVVHHDELVRFLDRVPDDVLVVIDEAYVQFNRDPQAADGLALYRERGNVCVLRTFSKAYGLANLRVGFAIAPGPIAEAIRLTTLPFPVSTVAEEAALTALAIEPALFERVDQIVAERNRVTQALRDQGWDIPATETNFVWFPLGVDADPFAIACEAEGAVIRAFPGDGCRVTIGETAANDIVLEVAARWRKSHA